MRPFHMSKKFTNIRGQFYPTGHIVAMFPNEAAAREACKALTEHGFGDEEVCWITPEVMMGEIARTVGTADLPLPSPGTEADTVRRFSHLAAQGHHALLIHAPHHQDDERLMEALHRHGVSHAQKYRMLVIEDLA